MSIDKDTIILAIRLKAIAEADKLIKTAEHVEDLYAMSEVFEEMAEIIKAAHFEIKELEDNNES